MYGEFDEEDIAALPFVAQIILGKRDTILYLS